MLDLSALLCLLMVSTRSVKNLMTYTRLLPNFQPKSKFCGRRQFIGGMMALVGACGFGGAYTAAAADRSAPQSGPAPSMTVPITDKAGNAFRLERYRGTPLLINFWATWCPPCVAELPALDRAATALAGSVTVLLVSVDRGGSAKALPFLEQRAITTPVIGFDPKAALSREMGVRGLPTTFLIDANQAHSWSYLGPRDWDQPDMLNSIRALLGIKSTT
ncbi:MAG: TlpA family protein disulfide reductase [Alphaproteobacteria bacterium]|nr:TlpA family protein disulfide reductase [Alphaproteobacteria bacterium]